MENSNLIPRCFNSVSGSSTTVAVEQQFWDAFDDILAREDKTLGALLREIDRQRGRSAGVREGCSPMPLARAVRTYVLAYFYKNRPKLDADEAHVTDELVPGIWTGG